MPYVITTKQRMPLAPIGAYQVVSRRAVATLDEARAEVLRITGANGVVLIFADGGTIGPRLDGTVIEVKPITEAALRLAIPECNTFPVQLHADGRHLIDAYNGKETTA